MTEPNQSVRKDRKKKEVRGYVYQEISSQRVGYGGWRVCAGSADRVVLLYGDTDFGEYVYGNLAWMYHFYGGYYRKTERGQERNTW